MDVSNECPKGEPVVGGGEGGSGVQGHAPSTRKF